MSTNKTEVVEDPKLKKLVRVYLKMKSKRDEITQAFKEEEKVLAEQMDKVKAALLDYCRENGVEGARTTDGLFYRTVSTTYSTNDWEAMGSFIVEHNLTQLRIVCTETPSRSANSLTSTMGLPVIIFSEWILDSGSLC